jgi:hypothetical protein
MPAAVIAASPELMERELIKFDALAAAFAEALRAREIDDSAASLAAHAGMTVFRTAYKGWIDAAEEDDMTRIVDDVLGEFRAATAA